MEYNIKEVTAYIANFLGCKLEATQVKADELRAMPIALSACYIFYNLEVFGSISILAIAKAPKECSPIQLAKHQEILRNKFQRPVIFVLAQIESYNLTRLTQAKVNFIVPNKIIYAPCMMILIRNIANTPKEVSVNMPPVAQLLVLYHLQKQSLNGLDASRLADITGLAYSTVIKALNWLSINHIVTLSEGKQKYIQFVAEGKQLWGRTMSLMSSPVERILYADADLPDTFHAGESALGDYTMLAEPNTPIVALSKYLTKPNKQKLNKQYGKIRIEIWRYNPAILAENGIVDRLSLYLSLMNNEDERVQMECDTLINEMVW